MKAFTTRGNKNFHERKFHTLEMMKNGDGMIENFDPIQPLMNPSLKNEDGLPLVRLKRHHQ